MADVLAIVGSTRFADVTAVDAATTVIMGVFARKRPDVVVSGGAEGIDTLGVRLAREHGIDVVEHKPAHPRWQPDGYKARNDLIADTCTRLLRIVCRWSITYGSGYTRDRAHAQGKTCWSLQLPGSVLNGLIWVRHSRATVGLDVKDGVVADTAPYARSLGWVGRGADELIGQMLRCKTDVRWVPDGAVRPPATRR